MSEELDTSRRHFAEDMGIALERAGYPRMAGRIIGILMITTENEVSTEELARVLGASRGSLSTMTRMLVDQRLIERAGKPGDRRDYFRIRSGAWTAFLRTRLQEVTSFHLMVENGLHIVSSKEHAPYTRLQQLHEFYEFFQKEFEAMLDRWEHRKRRASKRRTS
jgi:DNA-binding transcriptional regulator GbsR (MarR family)